MKIVVVLSGIILLILAVVCCEKELRNSFSTIELVKTNAGGCNTMELKSSGEDPDTVIFSVLTDSLDIFAGINYTCCTPFSADLITENDSLLISIRDICQQDESCYCHCLCYYTWSFKLLGFENKNYDYKVTLYGRDITRVIQKGTFTVTGPDVILE